MAGCDSGRDSGCDSGRDSGWVSGWVAGWVVAAPGASAASSRTPVETSRMPAHPPQVDGCLAALLQPEDRVREFIEKDLGEEGIDLGKISTSMTINATAAIMLCMVVAVARKQAADLAKISGTVQNDILKEYSSRGTYIFPPEPSIRLIGDTIEYCIKHIPNFNSVSVSGTHICECACR